ncbi:YppG family protein [Sutcliffiella rhizosphaerae]|uniref:YppG-like protein n=1 Tax=Sutcliffiella rhizosphaerae TaxID=2880967 RepID=A0ABM8YRI2_9BACI|nr:YppG family protein [Sutcliffiella rhizosphaerae]CAG9622607.1 hypothetical protein BACCIP111883_03398 [Sutcliffiella rhizosphaerae]
MFRRMYGRPRHLSYNRNMPLLNQLPILSNFLPNGYGGWGNSQQGMMMNQMPYMQSNNVPQYYAGNSMDGNTPIGYPGWMEYMGQNHNPQGMNMPSGIMGPNSIIPSMQSPAMYQQGMSPNGWSPTNQMQMPFMNPYPTQTQNTKPPSSFMNQFKGQDGNVDMKKMMDTAGQMMNTVNQLNSMVKGIAATFKA